MAIAAATVFEVRTTGSDSNGGGFVTGSGGSDFSQQNSAQGTGTNLTVDATTNTDVTPDSYTVSSADVGNIIQITTTGGGAAFTVGFYQIVSIQGGTKWRLDRSPAATSSSGASWSIGGALASPGMASGAASVSGNIIWVKSGTYTITSTSSNVSNGRLTGGTKYLVRGYNSTRADLAIGDANRPVIKAGVNSLTIFTSSSNYASLNDLVLDGDKATRTSTTGTAGSSEAHFYNVLARNFTSHGFSGSSARAVFCEAADNTAHGMAIDAVAFSWSHGNGGSGFGTGVGGTNYFGCVSSGNGSNGFQQLRNARVINCTAYNNTGDGADGDDADTTYVNCIFYGNGGYGIDDNGMIGVKAVNCAFRNNTSGANRSIVSNLNFNPITLTADPFVNAAAGNFALNAAAGGGALLRALGYGTLPGGLTVGYPDVGAVQARSTSGKRLGVKIGRVG